MHEFGLDRPLYVQYVDYLGHVLQGDLGHSIVTQEPVLHEFLDLVSGHGRAVVLRDAVRPVDRPAGRHLAALKRNTVVDYAVMGVSLTGYSMPIFWWALLLILLFSVHAGLDAGVGPHRHPVRLSAGHRLHADRQRCRRGEPGAFRSAASHLILPAIVLGTIPLAVIARMTRSSMLEVLREDYVRTARAKGLSRVRVIGIHALRNALIPVVTVIGLQVGTLLAGAILTETIFSWPGIGKWLVDAIHRRDYPVVQGGILLSATIIIVVNLIVDLLYGVINPRIRHSS